MERTEPDGQTIGLASEPKPKRYVVCLAETDALGRRVEAGPNWHAFKSDLPAVEPKEDLAEAWMDAMPLIKRCKAWGWSVVNAEGELL